MAYENILRLICLCFCIAVVSSVCPCSSPDLCKPISKKYTKELVVFATPVDLNWKKWNWTEITNVVFLIGTLNETSDLYCYAHSQNVRVSVLVTLGVEYFTKLWDSSFRQQVIEGWINELLLYNLDGLNMIFENPAFTQDIKNGISTLTAETNKALKNMNPNYLLTFDIPYSSRISGYRLDYVAISKSTDYMIVMDYDTTIDRLIASATSPINLIKESYNYYLFNLSLNPMDMVMAVPWYAYDYTCSHFYNRTGDNLCTTLTTGGILANRSHCRKMFSKNIGGLKWHPKAESPYFTTKENGVFHQYQFDTVDSLIVKFKLAVDLGLRGLGMYKSNSLDYISTDPSTMQETVSLWNSISEYVAYMKLS